jgi:hypothetical protein
MTKRVNGHNSGKAAMASVKPAAAFDLADNIRRHSGFALNESAATGAARNFAGFMTLLVDIAKASREDGIDNESDGSAHRFRKTDGRPYRVRNPRAR